MSGLVGDVLRRVLKRAEICEADRAFVDALIVSGRAGSPSNPNAAGVETAFDSERSGR